MKQTAFRLTDEDLALIDAAKRKSGMLSRADALRYVLRFWAEAVGVEPSKLKLAKKTKPKPR